MSQLSTLRSIGYLKVTGVLVTQTPIRVGSSKSDGDIDLPVLRDGQGRVLIPGSSLAGSVRSSCRDLGIEESLVNRLFGETEDGDKDAVGDRLFGETEDGDKDAVGDTSWFSFSDTAIDHPVEFRNGVGIDRRTGTAAAQALYSYEVLPRGVRLPFSMEVELPSGAVSDFRREEIEEVLKKILAGMARGEVSVGGGQTRGLGRTRLEDFEIRQFQFDTPENTLMALNNGELLPDFVDVSHEDYSGLKIDVSWDSIGNVMSADGGEGLGVDTLPLVGLVDKDQISVVLPGSGIKGVLRQRAEFIVRTLEGTPLVEPSESEDIDHLSQVSGSLLVNALFGEAAESSSGKKNGRRGALSINDCYGSVRLSPKDWRQVLGANSIEDVATKVDAMNESNIVGSDIAGTKIFDPVQHVAIDRWTGGSAERFLYSVLEVRNPQWEDLKIYLNQSQLNRGLNRQQQNACIGLLFLLLRDLHKGRLRFGYGAMRGSGRMKTTAIAIDGLVADRLFEGAVRDLPNSSHVQPLLDALRNELVKEQLK